MIQILLLILKIIGITILAILGLILLVLALVLFVPVFYKVRIIHNPQETKITGKVSFLWPAIVVIVQYFKKLSYKVKLFGISLLDSEKPKKEKTPKKKKEKKQKKKKAGKSSDAKDTLPEEEIFAPLENPGTLPKAEPEDEASFENVAEESESFEETTEKPAQDKEKKPGLFAKIKAKIQKLRETISKTIAKIKKLIHQKEEVQRILGKPETKTAMKFVWSKLGRLLKHILPRKIKGYLAYGADNPATTGQVLGILSVLYARTGQLLEIRPNFTEKQLECDVLIKGRIQVFTLLVIAVKVALNKELRQVIKEFKGIKEIE
ncbi:MAG: hypothetical protein IKL28_00030 [Lachnospiraceae bacterium]|nr:hypothetical protein [Lachnospiraceae bacterium]